MKGTTAITTMLPSTKCLPVLEGGIRTQILFIKLGWNIYGRIFLRRANDTVMDGNLALLITPNVWVFTSSNSLQTPAGCATIYFNSVTNNMESVQIPQEKSSAPQDCPPRPNSDANCKRQVSRLTHFWLQSGGSHGSLLLRFDLLLLWLTGSRETLDILGQRMSPAISVNKGYFTDQAISHCGLHPGRIQDGGKNKILALDSYGIDQRNNFNKLRLLHLPIYRKVLN